MFDQITPAVIVAYYGGVDVLNELVSRGYSPIRIQLHGHKDKNQFLIQFFEKGDDPSSHVLIEHESETVESLALKLKGFGVTHIIPADEAGVELSDLLCDYLKLPFNGIELSKARRNKQMMHQQVALNGCAVPLQTTVSSLAEFDEWMVANNVLFPVVVKPLNGAGSAGVTKCHTNQCVKKAFNEILKIVNLKNTVVTVSDQFIVQEFLQGTEYVVDTVSLNGTHKLIDIWRCKKSQHNNGSFVYEYFDLVDHSADVCSVLYDYACCVLDSLGIKLGPGHAEIYIKEDGTPILVEIGSRLGGPRMPFGTQPCVESQKAQTEYAVDAYIEPHKFSDQWDNGYKKIKNSRMVFLIHYEKVLFNGFNNAVLDQIRSLESYYHHEFTLRKGDYLKQTVDVRSSPGFIYLTHDDQHQIELDYAEIRRLEKKLYC